MRRNHRDGDVTVSTGVGVRPYTSGRSRLGAAPPPNDIDPRFLDHQHLAKRVAASRRGPSAELHRLGTRRSRVPGDRSGARVGRDRHVRARCPLCLAHPSARPGPDRDLGRRPRAAMGRPRRRDPAGRRRPDPAGRESKPNSGRFFLAHDPNHALAHLWRRRDPEVLHVLLDLRRAPWGSMPSRSWSPWSLSSIQVEGADLHGRLTCGTRTQAGGSSPPPRSRSCPLRARRRWRWPPPGHARRDPRGAPRPARGSNSR